MKTLDLKRIVFFMAIIGLILSIPSIVYLVMHGNIDNYNGQNFYFLGENNQTITIIGTIMFALVIILSFLFYFFIIKRSNEFKNIKNILFVVLLVGLMFMICLPNTSTDIFYYMGTGILFQEYGENPYYTTISDFLQTGVNDPILEHSGYWSNTVVPYGPIWTLICSLFSLLSFGNNIAFLYIFKFVSLGIHLATCYIIYRITGKKKFALLYGLNPFLLLEFLTNVHNDLYLVFFVMLGIYFLKKKNNIWLALLFLACSILIKYVTVIIAPFFVLYYLRDKSKLQKILWSLLYAVIVIAIILSMYMIFFDSLADLLSILDTQQGRIKDSIYLLMLHFGLREWTTPANATCTVIFAYAIILYTLIGIFRKEKFSSFMNDIKNLLFILIFGVLTNLTSWYLSWFFIPMYWLKSKDIRSILCIQFLYELTYVYFFYVHSDAVRYQIIILPFIFIIMAIRQVIIMINQRKGNINCKKMKNLS